MMGWKSAGMFLAGLLAFGCWSDDTPEAQERGGQEVVGQLAQEDDLSSDLSRSLVAQVSSVVIHPDAPRTVYAGSRDKGIFKSTKAGRGWTEAHTGISYPWEVQLAIDPNDPLTLYAATMHGLFKTTDGAQSWAALPMPYPEADLVVTDPIRSGVVYATPPVFVFSAVFKSEDGGQTWMNAHQGLIAVPTALAVDPQRPDTLYAGTWRWGVYKTTDGAGSWNEVGLRDAIVYTIVISGDRVFAVTDLGVYLSTDGSASWQLLLPGEEPAPRSILYQAIAVDPRHPQQLLLGTNLYGILRSVDGGQTWQTTDMQGQTPWVFTLVFHPTRRSLVFAGTYDGLYWSRDGGRSWQH
jgi:photosystem II stability/assembly factor-like uncharacterized protein